GWDFSVLCHLIRPHSLRIWFLFVSTDTAVRLTSLHASRQTSLPLAWLRDVTPALKGLYSPSNNFPMVFMNASHFTRWNGQLFDLYSPFKAHTRVLKNGEL